MSAKLGEVQTPKAQDVQTKKCPSCGVENPISAKFCKVDGYNFQQTEGKPVERPAGIKKTEDEILCPKCGTSYPLTAKFCKKDGTPLQTKQPETTKKIEPISERAKLEPTIEPKDIETKSIEKEIKLEPVIEPKAEVPPEVKAEETKAEIEKSKIDRDIKPKETVLPKVEVPPPKVKPKLEVKKEVEKKPSKARIWITVVVLVFAIGGVGGYLYFSGEKEKKATETTVKPPEIEKPKHPEPQVSEEAARPPVGTPEKVKPTAQLFTPEPSKLPIDISRVESDLNGSLRNRGLNDVYAKVNKDLTATLAGTVNDPRDKMLASTIAESFKGIKNVNNEIIVAKLPPPVLPAPAPEVLAPSPTPISKIDPAKLEGDINRTLRNAGLSGVTAVVNDNLEVTLKGSVGSKYEKDRAFEIAKTFKEAKRIKDIIFVVEQ